MRRVTDKILSVNITGYLTPFYSNEQPVLVEFPESDDKFVLVFSTEEKLKEGMKIIPYDKIKQIQDGVDFLESIIAHARVAVDPWVTSEGNTRWVEVLDYFKEDPAN